MITASKLRQDVYRLLDEVLESGKPLEILRNGRVLRVVSDTPQESRLERLRAHDSLLCDPDEIVHMDWSEEWNPNEPTP